MNTTKCYRKYSKTHLDKKLKKEDNIKNIINHNPNRGMKIKKISLEALFYALKGTEGVLSLSESRARDSFMKPVGEFADTYNADKVKIYEAFAMKKEDGSIDFKVEKSKGGNETKSYQFSPEKLTEINKELTTLAQETVELPELSTLKEMLEKTTYKPKVGESALLDEILANE